MPQCVGGRLVGALAERPEEGPPCGSAKRQRSAVAIVRVPHEDDAFTRGRLDTVTAVGVRVSGLTPVSHVSRISLTSAIDSEALRHSDRSVSNIRSRLVTGSGSVKTYEPRMCSHSAAASVTTNPL